MEERIIRVAARWTKELGAHLEHANSCDAQIRAGCSAFLELALRKMRDDAHSKAQRLMIKLEALEELLKD